MDVAFSIHYLFNEIAALILRNRIFLNLYFIFTLKGIKEVNLIHLDHIDMPK